MLHDHTVTLYYTRCRLPPRRSHPPGSPGTSACMPPSALWLVFAHRASAAALSNAAGTAPPAGPPARPMLAHAACRQLAAFLWPSAAAVPPLTPSRAAAAVLLLARAACAVHSLSPSAAGAAPPLPSSNPNPGSCRSTPAPSSRGHGPHLAAGTAGTPRVQATLLPIPPPRPSLVRERAAGSYSATCENPDMPVRRMQMEAGAQCISLAIGSHATQPARPELPWRVSCCNLPFFLSSIRPFSSSLQQHTSHRILHGRIPHRIARAGPR